jgi:hypothetical protein
MVENQPPLESSRPVTLLARPAVRVLLLLIVVMAALLIIEWRRSARSATSGPEQDTNCVAARIGLSCRA